MIRAYAALILNFDDGGSCFSFLHKLCIQWKVKSGGNNKHEYNMIYCSMEGGYTIRWDDGLKDTEKLLPNHTTLIS